MNAGDRVWWNEREGIVCRALDGKAQVQFVGAKHGPQWVDQASLRASEILKEDK